MTRTRRWNIRSYSSICVTEKYIVVVVGVVYNSCIFMFSRHFILQTCVWTGTLKVLDFLSAVFSLILGNWRMKDKREHWKGWTSSQFPLFLLPFRLSLNIRCKDDYQELTIKHATKSIIHNPPQIFFPNLINFIFILLEW